MAIYIEIESLIEFQRHLNAHADLNAVVVQGLDLTSLEETLRERSSEGAVFLGCVMSAGLLRHVLDTGGLVFPRIPDLPYHPYRAKLYTAESLTQGYIHGDISSFSNSYDQRIYQHFDGHRRCRDVVPIVETLAQRLHDHAIDDALEDFLVNGGHPRKVVAVMGGHGMKRTDDRYGQVARIAHRLTRHDDGYTMATGGGPGAMQATNLGAWLAGYPEDTIDIAVALLRDAPTYKHPAWWDTALNVRARFPNTPGVSLGIPTWHYGHEPPNLFATHIAKYFSNSLREDGLLAIARHGVVYAPGSAGTIQEIFMDACQNHYGTFGDVSAMVFLGEAYWQETKPVYPLLKQLASGHQYADSMTITDNIDALVSFIVNHPPVPYHDGA